MAALLILIVYVIVYLATITQRKRHRPAPRQVVPLARPLKLNLAILASIGPPGSSPSCGPTDLAAD
jgi:hypothetical protein